MTKSIWVFGIIIGIFVIVEGLLIAVNINGAIVKVIHQLERLVNNILDGKLDARGNPDKVTIDFKEVLNGVNHLIKAFVKPINVTLSYVDRISKGDIPEKIADEYKGDFNEIKKNLNQAVDVMNGLLAETNALIEATRNGQLGKRGNAGKFTGGWSELVGGVNDLIEAFVKPINVTADYVDKISNGIIPEKITDEYKGDFNKIRNNLNQALEVLSKLVNEMNILTVLVTAFKLNSNQIVHRPSLPAAGSRKPASFQTKPKPLKKSLDPERVIPLNDNDFSDF